MSGQFDARIEQNGTGRALVLVRDGNADAPAAPETPSQKPGNVQPATDIGFLAQLMACHHGVRAYRRHRREEPAVASLRYRAGAGGTTVPQRRTVRLA